MPTKYKGVHVVVVDDHNIAKIIRSPSIDSDLTALSLQDRPVKRRKNKDDGSSRRNSTKEQNDSISTSVLEDLPGQIPSDDCADSATGSQTSSSTAVKTAKKKKARESRKSTEQPEEHVEVYISKFTPTETRLDNTAVEKDLAKGLLPMFNRNNSADEEDTDNGDAVMINNVLQSEFFKVNCSETHLDQGIKSSQHNGHSSEDYFIFNEPTQGGSEREDQIHEGDDDQMCSVSNHSNDSPAEPVLLNCKTATHSSDGLEFKEVPSEELPHRDLTEQSIGEVKDVDCPVCAPAPANEVTPEGTSGIELVQSEAFEEKLPIPIPHSSPCSAGQMLPDKSRDQTSEEPLQADPEPTDSDFKPVGVACFGDASFPIGCLEVTLECEVQAGSAEPSSSLLSSPEFKKSRIIYGKWKRNSRGRRMKAFVGFERPSYETESSDSVEPRQAKARTKKHSGIRLTDEGSSVSSQDEAAVRKSRTIGTKTPRTVDSKTQRTVDSRTPTTVDSRAPRTVDSRAPRTVDSRTPRTVDSRTPRTVDSRAPRTVDSRAPRTVDSRTPRTVDSKTPRTVDSRTPRTATKIKVMAEQTLISKPTLTEGSSTTAKNKLINDHTDRPMQEDKTESSVAKTSRVVKSKSDCGQTGKTESLSAESEFKSMSVLIKKCQPNVQRKSIARQAKSVEPALEKNSVSKPGSSKRPASKLATTVGKSVSIGKYDLLETTHSIVKLKSKSEEAQDSVPPVVEKSSSVKRPRGAVKRKVTASDDGSSDADRTEAGKSEPALKIKPPSYSVAGDTVHKVSSETVDNLDKMVEKLGDSACLTVDVTSPTPDAVCASQNLVSGSKSKPSVAYVFPPSEYISFNHSGDMEISDIIMNALPQLVENGFSQIYLFAKNAPLPSSDKQERLVFAADLNSTPFKFIPTSLPNKKSEPGTLADKVPEPQTVTEISGSQKPLRRVQSKGRLPRKTTLCSSSFDDSGHLDAEDSSLSVDVDMTSTTEQLMPDTRERVTNWTCVDTSAWLEKHGLDRLLPSFSFIDGPSLIELAHYFNEDIESATGYLHDMGFIFNDQIQLFDALRTIPTQTFVHTCLSSVGISHAGQADLSSEASAAQDMAAPPPRKRGRKPKAGRLHPINGSQGTNSPAAQSGAEVRASTLKIPLSQWTDKNVSTWLTMHGLSRFLPEFAHFNGQRMCTLVNIFNTNVGAVYKMLSRMDFTLFESLKFCARLRELSQSLKEASLNSTKV